MRYLVVIDKRAVSLSATALLLFLVSGCGYEVTMLPPAPVKTPPSNPPPEAAQQGSVTISPRYAALGQGGSLQFHATVAAGGAVEWMVDDVPGGNATIGTVSASGVYMAPATLAQSENVTVTAALASSPNMNYATSVVSLIQPGVVTPTINPQVATYSIYLPAPGSVTINFGPSSAYGLATWTQTTPSPNGGEISIFVAGMLGLTPYHMQAEVVLDDGTTFTDVDQTFTTGTPPSTASVVASSQSGGTPQPGIELFDAVFPAKQAEAFATDLSGNVIWTYSYAGSADDVVQPIRLLSNGHFLVQISYASSASLIGERVPAGALDEVREVDLAGNTIRSVTRQQLANALTMQGNTIVLGSLHHDVLELPNGHLVLLLTTSQSFQNLPGYPGTTNVLGDVLVDVDQNLTPDWVWNSFDYLDVNRHPYLFPDWTHSNSLLYSTDDHNLLLSIRHQNWIVKIDFQDGTGSGNILWKLGEGGDFSLEGGTDPTDWFYAQHGFSFFSANTTGVFKLGVMDNGDDREFPSGIVCGASGAPPCHYSTASILQVDESTKTATLIGHYIAPASMYSFFGGNVDPLANGDFEANFGSVTTGAVVDEFNGIGAQQIVWQAKTPNAYQYRVERLPSLYPGVQW
jgi:hypothetical protein